MSVIKSNLIVVALLCVGANAAYADTPLTVIVHKDVATDDVTTEQVMELWLGVKRKLPGTEKLKVVDQPKNSELRAEFYSVVVGKTPGQAKAYWAKVIFTGKDYPPKILDSDSAIIHWVARTPNSIGYIRPSALNDSVRVLLKLPAGEK